MSTYQEVYNNRNERNTQNLSAVSMKSINKIIQNEGYSTYSINVRDISTEGGNFLSSLKELDIKGKTDNRDEEINLFIKQRLPDDDKNIFPPKEIHSKEMFIYTKFAGLFNELQNEFNIPDQARYNFAKSYNEGNEDSLILDNMIRKGFKICDRFDAMPLKAIQMSIKQLAKFHGFSMVLKQYKPDFYNSEIKTKKHSLTFDVTCKKVITALCNISLEYLDDEKKNKLEKYVSGLINKYYCYIYKNESKVKCLCHGDYRNNNILVKEMNGEATTVIPIDYQFVYYGAPVTDIFYMIFMSTDQQLRKNYMNNFKNVYYESLTEFLRYFRIDVESVYPQQEYENDFKNQLDYGLIISLCVLPFAMTSKDDVPEFNTDLKTMKLHENFNTRMGEIVDDFIEWGYL